MENTKYFTPVYFGSQYARMFESILDRSFASIITFCPILLTPGLTEVSLRGGYKVGSKKHPFEDNAHINSLLTQYKSIEQMDPHFAKMGESLSFYEATLRFGDCLYIDADLLETAMGQWFIQRMSSLGKSVWSLGVGVANSPLAPLFTDGTLHPKAPDELFINFEYTYHLMEFRKPI